MRCCLAALDSLARWAGRLAVVLLLLIGLFVVWEVASRYLFNAPTIWSEEISRLLMVWATYAAAAVVLQEGRLIAIDVLTRLLPPFWLRLQRLLALLAILGFSLVAVVWGSGIVAESLAVGRASSTMLRTPQWLFELPVPLGFALLAVQALAQMARLALGWEEPSPPEHGR